MDSPTPTPSEPRRRASLHGLAALLALLAPLALGAPPGCEANRSVPSPEPAAPGGEERAAPAPATAEAATPPEAAHVPDAGGEGEAASGTAPGAPRRVLANACASDRELAKKVLEALEREDAAALHALRVTEAEYKTYLFPEFPAAEPGRTIPVDFHWGHLNVRSFGGVDEAVQTFGGRKFELLDVIPTRGIEAYKSYRILNKVELDVRDRDSGELLRIKVFGSVVELDGQYKILGFPT